MRLLILILSALMLSPVLAEDNKKEKSPTVSPWLYKKLQKTDQLIAKKSYTQAEQKLKAILPDAKEKSYEKTVILRSLSSVYALKGQYKKAASMLAKAVALKTLQKKQEQQAILNLGQLYMAAEQYSKAIQVLEPWLVNNSTPNAEISALTANAYAQLKQYRKALPFIKKAIAKSKNPDESWYQLNLALYYELDNYHSAAKLLQTMITMYPDKKEYWSQLSSIYQQLKQFKKATSIKHLAYKKGFITSEKELLELVNLFLYINAPYKSAHLLEQSITNKKVKYSSTNWESLAHAWTLAKEYERAIKALEIASSLSSRGGLYQRLGQIYVEQERWEEAIQSFNKALSKGNLKNTGATYLLLGMSYYESQNNKQAKKAFLKAKQYNKNRNAAKQWLEFIKAPKRTL